MHRYAKTAIFIIGCAIVTAVNADLLQGNISNFIDGDTALFYIS